MLFWSSAHDSGDWKKNKSKNNKINIKKKHTDCKYMKKSNYTKLCQEEANRSTHAISCWYWPFCKAQLFSHVKITIVAQSISFRRRLAMYCIRSSMALSASSLRLSSYSARWLYPCSKQIWISCACPALPFCENQKHAAMAALRDMLPQHVKQQDDTERARILALPPQAAPSHSPMWLSS